MSDLTVLFLLCTGVLVVALLALFGYGFGGKYRPWVFSVLGGLYALIPLVYMILYADKGGDPGPMYIFLVPPFLPQYVTFMISALVLALIYGRSGSYHYVYVIGAIINLLMWAVIGCLTGIYLRNTQDKSRVKIFWIILSIIVFLCLLFYVYAWWGFRWF